MVGPLGPDPQQTVNCLRTGQTATRWLPDGTFPTLTAPGTRAAAPAVFDSTATDRDPVVEMALQSARQAMDAAAMRPGDVDPQRLGCVIGTSKGTLASYARNFRAQRNVQRATEVLPASDPWVCGGLQPNLAALEVAREWNAGGACLCPVAACATGLHCIARGAELIESGMCDVVLAGSSDASVCDWVLSGFQRLGVLARDFDDPAHAVRPFDQNRSGFLVGEGAAVLVLERREHAAARGRVRLATWLAGGSAADPTGITQIDTSGAVLAELTRRTLQRAGLEPADVGCISLHGTGTVPNDLAEASALRAVFGDHCPPAGSLKGALGHLLGAAGSVELALSLLALRQGVCLPTANLADPLPELPDCGGSTPTSDILLKTSLGFGGHVSVAVLQC